MTFKGEIHVSDASGCPHTYVEVSFSTQAEVSAYIDGYCSALGDDRYNIDFQELDGVLIAEIWSNS